MSQVSDTERIRTEERNRTPDQTASFVPSLSDPARTQTETHDDFQEVKVHR